MSDYAVVNPATGQTLATYPTTTDAELETAIASADGDVPLLARGPRARAGGANPPGRRAPPRAAGRARGDHRARDGQAPGRGAGRGGLRRRHHGVLRRQRREDHGRPADRHPGRGHRRHPPLAAGGAPGDHAVELPLLPGGAFRGPEPRGRQHDPPQARPAVPRVGGGDPRDLP